MPELSRLESSFVCLQRSMRRIIHPIFMLTTKIRSRSTVLIRLR